MIVDSAGVRKGCLDSVFGSKSRVPNPSRSIPILPWRTHCLMDYVSSSEKVEKVLSSLEAASMMGPDDISAHLLKSCSAILASPLSALFSYGQLLPNWKPGNVTHIHRDAKTDPLHYRPQSLLAIARKVMEYIMIHNVKSSFQSAWSLIIGLYFIYFCIHWGSYES